MRYARCLAAAGLVAVAVLLYASSQAAFLHDPYLQNVRADRATILWTARDNLSGLVQFSSDGISWQSAPATVRAYLPRETGLTYTFYQYQADLAGLRPGANYLYRVMAGGQTVAEGDDYRFSTSGSGPFRFIVFADSWPGGSPEQMPMAVRMAGEEVAFGLLAGDVVNLEGTFEQFQSYYFDYYWPLMRRVPFFPSPGNHDYYTSAAGPYLAVHVLPTEGVAPEDQERYYSFDWGNAHFVSLDTNIPLSSAVGEGGPMLAWLEQDLRQTRKFWRVVYFHHTAYPIYWHRGDPQCAMVREKLVPILEKYNVHLVLAGHEHLYMRTLPMRNGTPAPGSPSTVYVTTGGAGGALHPASPLQPFMAVAQSVFHYVRGEADGYRMTLRAIRYDGAEFDNFSLAPPPLVTAGAAVNAASFTSSLASGGLVSIFGQQLASDVQQASGFPLPMSLSGATVTMNSRPLPLIYVSPAQINAQLPFDVSGPATLEVTTPNGSAQVPVTISETAPAIFPGAILHADFTLLSGASPAQRGETIVIYATGLGRANGAINAGQAAPSSSPLTVVAQVEALVDGLAVTPSFAGLAPGFAGLYQVNLKLPDGLAPGTHSLQLVADGVEGNRVGFASR